MTILLKFIMAETTENYQSCKATAKATATATAMATAKPFLKICLIKTMAKTDWNYAETIFALISPWLLALKWFCSMQSECNFKIL